MIFIWLITMMAGAAWQPVATPSNYKCWPDLFGKDEVITSWANGKDRFVICTGNKLSVRPTYQLDSMFAVDATLDGKTQRLAREAEVGVKPLTIRFQGDTISLVTSLSAGVPYFERTITCAQGHCRLAKLKCLLKVEPRAAGEARALKAQLDRATGAAKLKLWASHFDDDGHAESGQRIEIAAMLGDATARQVVEMPVGADAGTGEVQSLLKERIREANQYCPPR